MTSRVIAWMTRRHDDAPTPHRAAFDPAHGPCGRLSTWSIAMSDPVRLSLFFRRAVTADAIGTTATAALMSLEATLLGAALGLPAAVFVAIGVALLPYVGWLLWLATRDTVARRVAMLPVLLNAVWAVDCLAVLWLAAEPTTFGKTFVLLQVGVSVLLAEMQWIGLRKRCAIVPA
jgi:hypothetical protein